MYPNTSHSLQGRLVCAAAAVKILLDPSVGYSIIFTTLYKTLRLRLYLASIIMHMNQEEPVMACFKINAPKIVCRDWKHRVKLRDWSLIHCQMIHTVCSWCNLSINLRTDWIQAPSLWLRYWGHLMSKEISCTLTGVKGISGKICAVSVHVELVLHLAFLPVHIGIFLSFSALLSTPQQYFRILYLFSQIPVNDIGPSSLSGLSFFLFLLKKRICLCLYFINSGPKIWCLRCGVIEPVA